MIYLDTSAAVKLAYREPETDALRAWLTANRKPLVASALVRLEAVRALLRREPAALPALGAVLALIIQTPITDALLDAAARIPEPTLRSLDAIHLATAEELATVLSWFVTYDHRLAEVARARGLPVVAPR